VTKERLSKLQSWILTNWDKIPYEKDAGIENIVGKREDYRCTLWIYRNYYEIHDGQPSKLDRYEKKFYKIPNNITVIVYNSLMNMEKKGLITIPYRGYRGCGYLYFRRTEKTLKVK